MGDIAYRESEKDLLVEQLLEIQSEKAAAASASTSTSTSTGGWSTTSDGGESLFMVHLGDIFTTARDYSAECPFDEYKAIADIFQNYANMPTFVLPGDNDWTDCPNSTIAWQHWSSNFISFEQNWASDSFIPSIVTRQPARPENFAFHHHRVLFMGLNLIAGTRNKTQPADVWDMRILQCEQWVVSQIDSYLATVGEAPRAVIVFGHARRGKDVFDTLEDKLATYGIPLVYLHGNGHSFYVNVPVPYWPQFKEVQVDQGANARPIKVTVRGTTKRALNQPFVQEDLYQHVLGGMIKIDRRGGLYPGAVVKAKDEGDDV